MPGTDIHMITRIWSGLDIQAGQLLAGFNGIYPWLIYRCTAELLDKASDTATA